MSKQPGFTVKQKTPTSAVVNGQEINLADFRAYLPVHNYIFMPCREPWPAASIDAVFPPQVLTDAAGNPVMKGGKVQKLAASRWLDRNQPAHQMTWAPGMPMLIPDRLVVDGGWIERSGVICLNLYRAPRLLLGDASKGAALARSRRKAVSDRGRSEPRHLLVGATRATARNQD